MLCVVCDMCAGAMKEPSVLLYCSPSYLPDPEGCRFSFHDLLSLPKFRLQEYKVIACFHTGARDSNPGPHAM